jgi:hypothetical protein
MTIELVLVRTGGAPMPGRRSGEDRVGGQERSCSEAPDRRRSQWASTGPNRCSSAARGSAPTIRSTSLPSRITTSNGIDCAPNRLATPGFASTSTFTTFRCPALRLARSSSTGEIIRHGPHHAAQKSTTTGTEAVVSAVNVSVSASTTHGSVDLHSGHRGTPWTIGPTRLRALQVGQPMTVIITQGRAWRSRSPDCERRARPVDALPRSLPKRGVKLCRRLRRSRRRAGVAALVGRHVRRAFQRRSGAGGELVCAARLR